MLTPSALPANDDPSLSDLSAPSATRRATAEANADREALLEHYRLVLDRGGDVSELARALAYLARHRHPDDVIRVARHVDTVQPVVRQASIEALHAFGLAAIRLLATSDAVGERARTQAMEILLVAHFYSCSRRDQAINPLGLDFKARFDELYAVETDIHEIGLRLVRRYIVEIRENIAGEPMGVVGRVLAREDPDAWAFLNHGGLIIAALAKNTPDELLALTGDMAVPAGAGAGQVMRYQWGGVVYELAIFLARHERPALLNFVATELVNPQQFRFGGGDRLAHIRAAALEFKALGDAKQALRRVEEQLGSLSAANQPEASHVHYLRARLLMRLGQHGAAVRALEEAAEVSHTPSLLALVDDAFDPVRDDPRVRRVTQFCELAARRVPPLRRPWNRAD